MPLILSIAMASSLASASPDPRLAGYRVAPGFRAAIAATEPMVVNPVTMTWAPDGRLFVIEWKEGRQLNDHIKALADTDGDGVFDTSEMYMDELDLPAGICFWDGWTYVTLDREVVRFHDPDLDGKYDRKEVVASGFGNDNSHHRVSGLVIGPDGWLYMTTGDSDCRAVGSDGSTATILRSGGVLRCKPDGSKLQVVAFGMRNPWGNVAFDDQFRIFHTDNDNEGSPGFTGCRILHVVEGGDYGWRLREGARCCQPDFERATWNGGRPGRLGWVAETGRGAPAGLCVLNSAAFPPSTRNLLVYPDVFRKTVRAYKVKPKGATFEVDREFELLASDEGLFRPTDAEIGPDGALYILDWRTDSGGAGKLSGNGKTGRIYRMTWGGDGDEPARKTFPADRLARLAEASTDQLVNNVLSPDYGLQLASAREVIRRGNRDLEKVVKSNAEGIITPTAVLLDMQKGVLDLTALARFRPAGDAPDPRFLDAPLASRWQAVIALHNVEHSDFDPYPFLYDRPEEATARRIALDLLPRAYRRGLFRDGRMDEKIVAASPGPDPEIRRSYAWALANLGPLFRAAPGDEVDPARARKLILEAARRRDELAKKNKLPDGDTLLAMVKTKDPKAQAFARELSEINKQTMVDVSADLVANILMEMAIEARPDDPFLRDGLTRAFDRLGEAGVIAVNEAIASRDPKRQAIGLFVLQGGRTPDAMNAILDLIDPPGQAPISLPPGAAAESFRTLREFGPAVPPSRVIAFLVAGYGADPEASVQAIRVLAAMPSLTPAEIDAFLPALIRGKDHATRLAALGLAASWRSDSAKLAVLEAVRAQDRPTDERKAALAAIRGYNDPSLAPMLERLYGTSKDASFSSELLRVLASMDFAAAAKFAERAFDSPDSTLRAEAIGLLGQKPETALIVANAYNAAKLPPEDLPRVIEAVRNHSSPELQAAMQKVLKNKLLAAPTGAEAGRLRDFVFRSGDPVKGRAIYLDARKGNCASCHRMEGYGGAVGPDLTRVWQTVSFEKRLESILEPSKEIKEGYNTVKVSTKDGRVSVGLLVANNAEATVLRDAQGREVRIPAAEIEEKAFDATSLMPAGVVGHLSFGELADLLAFLGDRRAQESLKDR